MREHHKRHDHRRRPAELRACGHRHGGHGMEHRVGARSFRRRFATREERIARLTEYLGELRAEAQAVEEKIARLQASS